jgi:hypothetical protein
MKKILLLLAIMLCCIAAKATDYTAYFTNPKNWDKVCFYVYSGSSTPNGSWDDTKTKPITPTYYGATKVWVATFSGDENASYTIIFHNADGTQTSDLKFVDKGLYTSTTTAPTSSCDIVATYGELAQEVNLSDYDNNPKGTCTVFFKQETSWSAPMIYAWIQDSSSSSTKLTGEWQGTEMTKTVLIDGSLYYTFNVTGVTSKANVKFSNKANSNSQSGEFTLNNKAIYSLSGVVSEGVDNYGTPDSGSDSDNNNGSDSDDYTIYFENTSNWANPYIYVWTNNEGSSATEHAGKWPGSPLTQTVEIDGKTYYTYTLDTAPTTTEVIFSNYGSSKTDDLPYNKGGFYNCSGVVSSGGTSDDDYASGELSNWLVDGLPVIYINVYTDSNHTELSDEILDKNLSHKNYFSATYWIDLNGSSNLLNVTKNVGSEASPLALDIKARGNFTRTGFAKKPFKLKLDKKQNLLGTSSKHYAILAHADDEFGFMRNFVGFNMGNSIDLPWTPNECPIQVVINGDYRGLYFLTESIRMGDSRIPATAVDDNAENPTDLTGGYLVELDNYEEPGTSQIQLTAKGSTGNTPLYITPDTPEEYSSVQTKFISSQFSTMNDYIGDTNDNLWSMMDLDDAARYYIVEEISGHWESYHGSTYLFRDKASDTDNGKWHFSPLWDFGNAFSTPENTQIVDEGANHYGNTWLKGLLQYSKFQDKVKETWKWFMSNKYGDMAANITTRANLISAAAAKDYLRWKGIKPTTGNSSGDYREVCDNTDMAAKAQTVINYLNNRINNMKSWSNFGDYSGTYSEPDHDTTVAAELPAYVKAGYVSQAVTYTIYCKGIESPRVWIWDEEGSETIHYSGDVWADRAYMTEATDINGDTYYYYSFTTENILSSLTAVIITYGNGGDDERTTAKFVNGAVYYLGNTYEENFDPDYFSLPSESTTYDHDHNLSTDPVTLYVYDKAGWGRVDMWLYHSSGGDYSSNWPGEQLTKDDNLYYDGYRGLYKFEVPANFQSDGIVIFSNNKADQYPAQGSSTKLTIDGKSHLFINSDNNWIEIEDPQVTSQSFVQSGTLPVLCIVTPNAQEITLDAIKGAKFKFFGADDNFFTDANGANNDAAVSGTIKGRGTTTWTDFNKKPYKIEFDAKQSFNAMPISKHWVLLPFAGDQATGYIKNPLGHYLAQIIDTDNWHPSMTGVELVINGEYKGLYFVAENIRPAAERVQINDVGDSGYSAENDWILEFDKYYTGSDAPYSWTEDANTWYALPQNPEVDDFAKVVKKGYAANVDEVNQYAATAAQTIKDAIDKAADSTINSATSSVTGYWDESWEDVIDAQAAVNFYLIQELMDDAEAYNTNLYLYHTSGKKWIFGPVWNFNGAFASGSGKSARLDENWAKKLYLNRYFRVRAIKTLDNLAGISIPANSGNQIASGSVLDKVSDFINNYYETYKQAIIADSKRWPASSLVATNVATKASTAAVPFDEFDINEMVEKVSDNFKYNADYLLNSGRDDNGGTTGAELIVEDLDSTPVYFNLQGLQIDKPQNGQVYIVRRGTSVAKELYK